MGQASRLIVQEEGWQGGAITDTFSYDDQGRRTSESANYAGLDNARYGLAWSYSDSGATAGKLTGMGLTRQTGTDGSTTTVLSTAYGYDSAGRLYTITGNTTATLGYELGSGNLSTTTTSTGNGDLVQTNHYNGTTGKLESVVTTRGATVIERDTFTYPTPGTAHADQIARKQVIRLTAGGTTETYYELYGYDDLNQLTSETRYSGTYGSTESHSILASETFSYDSLGNRTDLTSDVMNQYTQDANGHALSYDARGNLTGTWDLSHAYDELNRMVSATQASGFQLMLARRTARGNQLKSGSIHRYPRDCEDRLPVLPRMSDAMLHVPAAGRVNDSPFQIGAC